MSRNLASTECDRCGTVPVLTEEPRPITYSEAGIYFDQYIGMLVANADCPKCKAKYLAWVDERNIAFFASNIARCRFLEPRTADPEIGFFDLSYRSSFNDEPGQGDLPPWTPPLEIRLQPEDAEIVKDVLQALPATNKDAAIERICKAIEKAQHKRT